MQNKLHVRLLALKALLFWALRLLAINFLLLWIKFADSVQALLLHLRMCIVRRFNILKSKLPTVNLIGIKALLSWMRFTDRVGRWKATGRSMIVRGCAKFKGLSFRGFLKSLASRYLLYLVLINIVPLFALGWIYFGAVVVPASIHSVHSSTWWIAFKWVVVLLAAVHAAFSIVLLRLKKITKGYFLSLIIICSPFLYAYAGYARQVNGFSVSKTIHAIVPHLVAYGKLAIGWLS